MRTFVGLVVALGVCAFAQSAFAERYALHCTAPGPAWTFEFVVMGFDDSDSIIVQWRGYSAPSDNRTIRSSQTYVTANGNVDAAEISGEFSSDMRAPYSIRVDRSDGAMTLAFNGQSYTGSCRNGGQRN